MRSLASRLIHAPLCSDATRAVTRVREIFDPWKESFRLDEADRPVIDLLQSIADHSPYLWRLISIDPSRCIRLLANSPEEQLAATLGSLAAATEEPGATQLAVMTALRRAKQDVALLVAFADLGGAWSLAEITGALTAFADYAVDRVIRFLLAEGRRAGHLRGLEDDIVDGCGLVVLALGKQGSRELNYSSDIDLVVFFDPEAPALAETTVPSLFFVRLTKAMVRLLQETTGDGYCLRVDLRLRPDPASTAVAIALPSAFSYYETLGQNWERAAFIKARPVAGDLALGARFLADLTPFLWRRYFDYGAIADIHAMKRQIHAVRGQAEVAVSGHDLKLGRGGIREIEFFVQTQQLIFGGRRPDLRGSATLAMLAALGQDGWIDDAAVAELGAAYHCLRGLEHRLQMIADQQTQRLPSQPGDLERFARFAGFTDTAALSEHLLVHLRRVEHHYARLFEHAPSLDIAAGSLVFTGTAHDPDTIATIRALGFARPDDVSEIIRGWHFGRRPAVRSPRAREVLTELVPALLVAFSQTADPDGAIATLDTMLGRTSSAIELLSLLRSNAAVRSLFADVLGSAPRLATVIATRPHVLDAAIDPGMLRASGDRAAIEQRLAARVAQSFAIEDFLDAIRDFAQEELFLIGIGLLSGSADPSVVGHLYSDLADLLVAASLRRVLDDVAVEHGRIANGSCAVLALGKLGSRELTATSDLDLIVIYRSDPVDAVSDGSRPLEAARYYTRVTQRLIAALTVPTRRGRLYDVDVRLRPSGRQGPLATRLESFAAYQAHEAHTWEHMALTRARVVAGDQALAAQIDRIVRTIRSRPRDRETVRFDVAAMRALVGREKAGSGFWDMKLAPGGLLDIEFMAQFYALAFGDVGLDCGNQHPVSIIADAARLGFVPESDAADLIGAHALQTALTQLMRVTLTEPFDPEEAGVGVRRRLCVAANEPDLSALRERLAIIRQRVLRVRETVLGGSGPGTGRDPNTSVTA